MAIQEMRELEPILHYKMDEIEAKAYKIAIIWQDECARELPKEKYSKLNKKTDPRKTTLFKYCHKLAREMKGILDDRELPFYVRAQLQILKSIKEGEIHALIEPHCLVGEKAWKRWKVWRRKHMKGVSRILGSEEAGISASNPKMLAEISSSRDFLERKGCLDFAAYNLRKKDLDNWIRLGEISKYYVVLSPWAKKVFGDLSIFEFDDKYYMASVTPKIYEEFTSIFSHEFR